MTLLHDCSLDACNDVGEDSPVPKSSNWRWGVTTCIAAITGRVGLPSQQEDSIVTASDTRLSFGADYSADGSVKLYELHHDWSVMIAGSDIGQAVPVIYRAKVLLRGQGDTLRVAMDGFSKAYKEQMREAIENEYLSPFGMTLDEFKRRGKALLNTEVFTSLSFQIKNFKLGCTFLVYGLDAKRVGHLFTVRNGGVIAVHDKPGFWAIGNGAMSALSMLAALKQTRGRTPFAETVYNVLAAKYFSENASSVGPETILFIKQKGSGACSYNAQVDKDVRKIWEQKGIPKTNPKAVEIISNGEFEFPPRRKRSSRPSASRTSKDRQ